MNSLIVKPEKVTQSKMCASVLGFSKGNYTIYVTCTYSQSALEISI